MATHQADAATAKADAEKEGASLEKHIQAVEGMGGEDSEELLAAKGVWAKTKASLRDAFRVKFAQMKEAGLAKVAGGSHAPSEGGEDPPPAVQEEEVSISKAQLVHAHGSGPFGGNLYGAPPTHCRFCVRPF
jgi:hypothetical protein